MDAELITQTLAYTHTQAYTLGNSYMLVEQTATWGEIYVGTAVIILCLITIINKFSERASD